MALSEKLTQSWNIPYQRNPFFTGREEVLDALYQGLRTNNVVALAHPQGITGLGRRWKNTDSPRICLPLPRRI